MKHSLRIIDYALASSFVFFLSSSFPKFVQDELIIWCRTIPHLKPFALKKIRQAEPASPPATVQPNVDIEFNFISRLGVLEK